MKHIKAYVEKADENSIRVAIASRETEDRDGDVLKISDWDLKNFKRNPVLLDMHLADNSSTSVIGRVDRIWIDNRDLKFTPVFAVDENPRAKIIYDLYRGGYLRAFSVGFRPFKSKSGEVKNELLEISAVPVPANQDALVEMKKYDITPRNWNGEEIKVKQEKKKNGSVKSLLYLKNQLKSDKLKVKREIAKFFDRI